MPVFPLLETLDADQDGKLSKEEIDDAVAALKKLDKDGDGKLSKEEIGWPPAGMGRGGRRGPGMGPGPECPGGARRSPSSGPTLSFVERIMSNDKDGDGKVTQDELPDRMKWMTQRLDTNQDGAIDKAEAEAAATPLGQKKYNDEFSGCACLSLALWPPSCRTDVAWNCCSQVPLRVTSAVSIRIWPASTRRVNAAPAQSFPGRVGSGG